MSGVVQLKVVDTMRRVRRLFRDQRTNLIKWMRGKPLTYWELSSKTFDSEDVVLAKRLMGEKEMWFDEQPVRDFEARFGKWTGSKYAFSFCGGRESLVAIIKALELCPGDEVILPGYTCVVVANAFRAHGIRVNYCDIELDTFGLDADAVREKIAAGRPRAILIHHLYGLVCRDYEKLIDIAKNSNLPIIEDCAQATGALYKGVRVGNLGDVAFYSSEQTKIFSTVKGGVAVTSDDIIGSRLRDVHKEAALPDGQWIERLLITALLNYYQLKHPRRYILGDIHDVMYGHRRIEPYSKEEFLGRCGKNYMRKMPGAVAVLGLNQLRNIDRYNALRRESALKWDVWCERNGYRKPVVIPESVPVYLRYPVMVEPEKKRDISWGYSQLGVSLGRWFVTNVHPASWPVTGCPNADRAVASCVNFPT